MAVCRECSEPIPPTGRPGRPATRCEKCRGQSGTGTPAKRPNNSHKISDGHTSAVPGSATRPSPAKPTPGPSPRAGCSRFEGLAINDRICRHCLLWTWEH